MLEHKRSIPRLPPQKRWPDRVLAIRDHLVAASGEFIGTFLFLFFSFAITLMLIDRTVLRTPSGEQGNVTEVFIALADGMSLLVTAWAFYRVSGGLFNPAVVLGMCLSNALPWTRGLFLVPIQLLGGIMAAYTVHTLLPGNVEDLQAHLAPETTMIKGALIEMFLTSLLVFTILMLACEKSKDTFMAPVGIGLAEFVSNMAGVAFTGGALNPARALGPAVVSVHFAKYHWIYYVGPFAGAILAAGYFKTLKVFNYEDANPGQDADGEIGGNASRRVRDKLRPHMHARKFTLESMGADRANWQEEKNERQGRPGYGSRKWTL